MPPKCAHCQVASRPQPANTPLQSPPTDGEDGRKREERRAYYDVCVTVGEKNGVPQRGKRTYVNVKRGLKATPCPHKNERKT